MAKKGKGKGKGKGGKCRIVAILLGVLLLAASGGAVWAQCPGGVCSTYPSYAYTVPSCPGGVCYAPSYGYAPYRPTFGPAVQRPAIPYQPYRPAPVIVYPYGPVIRIR